MRRQALAVVGLAVAGSQAGHLVAYQARFGAAAQQMQSSGAHTYFPTLVKTGIGGAAVALMAALLLIGLARIVAQGSAPRKEGGPSLISLLAALFTIQLAWFVAQEVTEALVAGVRSDSAANLLLWGTLGQLPAALVAAIALRLLWTRVEASARELVAIIRTEAVAPVAVPVVIAAARDAGLALLLSHRSHSPFVKRGPPASSLIRAF